MTKAVFIASAHSRYNDVPGQAYHFPAQYLRRVEQAVGDWVIFYAGRRGGNLGYYAVQRVERIVQDTTMDGHWLALLSPGTLLDFEMAVPRLRPDGTPYETGLPLSRGSNTAAVRLVSDGDFAAIIMAGLNSGTDADCLPRSGPLPVASSSPVPGFAEMVQPFDGLPGPDALRDRILTSRAFRDASFARTVKRAYGARCAMSGLSLRNGGGRPEVEAAHILPVESNGPDTVLNGLALSGTLHWMFDRGLVSVDDDHSILVAKDSVADEVGARLLTADRRLILPADPRCHPHSAFLEWHRRKVFKG